MKRHTTSWIAAAGLGLVLTSIALFATRSLNTWLYDATQSFNVESARLAALAWILLGGGIGALVLWKRPHPMVFGIPALALITVNSPLLIGPMQLPEWMSTFALSTAGEATLALSGVLLWAAVAAMAHRRAGSGGRENGQGTPRP